MLYSARSDDFRTKDGRKKAFDNVKKHNIDGIVVIGGDGSFTGGLIFQKEFDVPVIGIPGTIDNDIFIVETNKKNKPEEGETILVKITSRDLLINRLKNDIKIKEEFNPEGGAYGLGRTHGHSH